MPVLANQKHELFAQAIAKGASQREAYCKAGYTQSSKPNVTDAAASRLFSDVRVQARIAEILERAADSVNYDLAWFLEQGAALFKAAKDAGDHSAASAQYQRLATVAGVWVEKTEGSQVVRTVSAEPMTPEQWQQQHAAPNQPLN